MEGALNGTPIWDLDPSSEQPIEIEEIDEKIEEKKPEKKVEEATPSNRLLEKKTRRVIEGEKKMPAPSKPFNKRNGIPTKSDCYSKIQECGIYYDDEKLFALSDGTNTASKMSEAKERYDGGLDRIPMALLSELSEMQRQKILAIRDAESLVRVLEKNEHDPTFYTAAMIQHEKWLSGEDQRRAQLFRQVLGRPEEREKSEGLKGGELPKRFQKKKTLETVKGVKGALLQLDKKKVRIDFSEEQLQGCATAAEKQLQGDHGGELTSIFHYSNTLYRQYEETMGQPSNSGAIGLTKDDGKQRIAEVLAAQQGLERDSGALPKPTGEPLFRWLPGHEVHCVGDVLSPQALYSSSAGCRATESFGEGEKKRTIFVINPLPETSRARLIQLVAGTKNWPQREFLYPSYTQFVVRKCSAQENPYGGRDLIHVVDELPHPVVQLSCETDSVGLAHNEGRYQISDGLSTETLVDKKHRKLFEAGSPSWEELKAAKVEKQKDAPDKPSVDNVYGKQTHESWHAALEHHGPRRTLLTPQSLLGFRQTLAGNTDFRENEYGWQEEPELDAAQIEALIDHDVLCYGEVSGETLEHYRKWVKKQGDRLQMGGKTLKRKAYLREIDEKITKKQPLKVEMGSARSFFEQPEEMKKRKCTVSYGKAVPEELEEDVAAALSLESTALEQSLALYKQGVLSDEEYMHAVEYHAATLQQRIVSVHPFDDGNGRLSRLMMYKVLQAYSLPKWTARDVFPKIDEPELDLLSSRSEWHDKLFAKDRGKAEPEKKEGSDY